MNPTHLHEHSRTDRAASPRTFKDRRDAGRRLAQALRAYADKPDLLVLALPRGGVPVADEVAAALHAPLDVFIVRKLGVPGHEELAMGAIASGGIRVLNEDVIDALHIDPAIIDAVAQREMETIEQRERSYRGDRLRPDVTARTILLIDDGIATGATMRAALTAIAARRPKWLVAAVPVAPPETCEELRTRADDVVCAVTPQLFLGVGRWYEDFSQTPDDEVRAVLGRDGNVA
jgi:putative phosphoribosyl transferase